jgi:hypothetical protein
LPPGLPPSSPDIFHLCLSFEKGLIERGTEWSCDWSISLSRLEGGETLLQIPPVGRSNSTRRTSDSVDDRIKFYYFCRFKLLIYLFGLSAVFRFNPESELAIVSGVDKYLEREKYRQFKLKKS